MTAQIVWWPGDAVHSPATHARVVATVRDANPGVASATAQHAYLLFVSQPLEGDALAMLAGLLGPFAELPAASPAARYVVPRAGMQTPWSSKATDILHRCGLAVDRIERVAVWHIDGVVADEPALRLAIADRMTQQVVLRPEVEAVFAPLASRGLRKVALGGEASTAQEALAAVNRAWGLALSPEEIEYLAAQYRELGRDPTDCELMMFAQANSEHCRHKIFNAAFEVDGVPAEHSLFGMIRQTTANAPDGVLSAYSDNAAVLQGADSQWLWPDADGVYRQHAEPAHIVLKVETHNHPTAISPFPGAATGSGGELRDEGATGLGGKPKAGMVGFAVSDLCLPDAPQPWETTPGKPAHIASPLQIMLEAPLGGAAYNNEFGRPALTGFFRTLGLPMEQGDTWGFHKPLMIAGGIGAIRKGNVHKRAVSAGDKLVVLGGPAMLIGLGGGAASSVGQGQAQAALDFASVQRDNAELERRCQEVINACAQADRNIIVSVHDVGAGGLANALPELVHADRLGATINLDLAPNADASLSPMELWCNESQERYVLAVRAADVAALAAYCERERCPFAVVGEATGEGRLLVTRRDEAVVDVPMSLILGATPRMHRSAQRRKSPSRPFDAAALMLADCVQRVLALPAVADKGFLVTIGDRTVGGLTARDQMIGPRQVPVADCGVTTVDMHGFAGEAFAVGERPTVAIIDAAASAQMAVAEALTNLAGTAIAKRSDIKLSCNWMAAAHIPGQDAALFDAVHAAVTLCKSLGIAVPVGKDSLSMASRWIDGAGIHDVVSPVTLVVTAAAPVTDVRKTKTPLLAAEGDLWLFDLGAGKHRLGGSALAQVYGETSGEAPAADAALLASYLDAMATLVRLDLISAYHDRADGGLFVTLFEMALASGCGLAVDLAGVCSDAQMVAALFSEELGGVVQVAPDKEPQFIKVVEACGLRPYCHKIAKPTEAGALVIGPHVFAVLPMRETWSDVTWRMQMLRDNETCANEEQYARIGGNALVSAQITGVDADPSTWRRSPQAATTKPRVAILRDQGVNGHVEMAAAFTRAGFDAVDFHVSDLEAARKTLRDVQGLAACGGFSYGDVLGAGQGWAKSMRFVTAVKEELAAWFAKRDPYFVLGVCNGCQMLSSLTDLIPGTEGWPRFAGNTSERYEARLVTVGIEASPSLLLKGMDGWQLPVVVSHGEGRAVFADGVAPAASLIAARYVNHDGHPATVYPYNPNGSQDSVAAMTNQDGRVTILMPHPERVFRLTQLSWMPPAWRDALAKSQPGGDDSPWMRLFDNARNALT